MRLTLRTLLAYLDDTLDPAQATLIGHKLAESKEAQALVDRIRKVTRRRGLSTPSLAGSDPSSDPNTVAGYLSDSLPADQLQDYEATCIESDPHLAEVAACHQILTLLQSEQMRVPPTAFQRMYKLVKGRESIPGRKPGHTIPVGGVVEPTADGADDSDAPLLLGLSAGKGGSGGLRWGVAVALAAGFVAAVVMVWPSGPADRAPANNNEVAMKPPTDPVVLPKPADPKPEDKKDPPKPPEDKKDPMPVPVEPMPVPPVEPMPEPKKNPLLDLVPAKTPPREGRFPVAKLDADEPPLIARKADAEAWTAVAGESNTVFTSDRVVCLPGLKTKIKPDGGQLLLWGNVPELAPLPILGTAITPHDPYQGYTADFTLHVGRVYLSATRPAGATFRVRFLEEIWDLVLKDDKTEVVVQVERTASPGEGEPRAVAVLHANAGAATFRSRDKDTPVAAGEELVWTSDAAGLTGPRKPDPKDKRQAASYFSRLGVAPDADAAKALLIAADGLAKRLASGAAVPGVVAELIQDEAPKQAAARLGVYAAAAAGEFGRVADAMNDPRQGVRVAARQAAREQFALPTAPDFLKAVAKKLELTEDGAKFLEMGLRGLTDAQKKNGALIDVLVGRLEADDIVTRDVALELLAFQVDPPAAGMKGLYPFDVAGPDDYRKPFVAAWKKRAEELKKAGM